MSGDLGIFSFLRLGKDGAAMLIAHDPHASVFDLNGKALDRWVKIVPGGLLEDPHLQAYLEIVFPFTCSLPNKKKSF